MTMTPHLTHHKLPLSPHSPSALAFTLFRPPAPTASTPLIVFINGLLTKSPDWEPITNTLATLPSPPYILTYDRFNIPPSDPLPENRVTNDISTAAHDLGVLLTGVYAMLELERGTTPLIMVGNSVGCCIVRLFSEYYRHVAYTNTRTTDTGGGSGTGFRLAGVLLLDSYIANTDFTSLFPTPSVGEPEALTRTRAIIASRFHPSVGNPEGLSRLNAWELLPSAAEPKFPGTPELVVVAHDPEFNVDDMVLKLGLDKECYLRYVQSAWDEYNSGLAQLSACAREVRAKGSGHFIHRDRPDLVVREIEAILGVLAE